MVHPRVSVRGNLLVPLGLKEMGRELDPCAMPPLMEAQLQVEESSCRQN